MKTSTTSFLLKSHLGHNLRLPSVRSLHHFKENSKQIVHRLVDVAGGHAGGLRPLGRWLHFLGWRQLSAVDGFSGLQVSRRIVHFLDQMTFIQHLLVMEGVHLNLHLLAELLILQSEESDTWLWVSQDIA